MREALADRACCVEGVLKCYRHETLETVIDRIAKAEVARGHSTVSYFQPSSLAPGPGSQRVVVELCPYETGRLFEDQVTSSMAFILADALCF